MIDLPPLLISIGVVLFILFLAVRSSAHCPHRGKCRYYQPKGYNCNKDFDRCGAYRDWKTRKDAWKK